MTQTQALESVRYHARAFLDAVKAGDAASAEVAALETDAGRAVALALGAGCSMRDVMLAQVPTASEACESMEE